MGVGTRARRYDLDFPRAKAVYVETDEAPRMARAYPVAGAIVTGDNLAEVLTCVRQLRAQLGPEACIAVVDRNFLGAKDELVAAGATLCGGSWLAVLEPFGAAIRTAKPRVPELRPVLIPPRRLH